MISISGSASAQRLVQNALKKIAARDRGLNSYSFEEICYELEQDLELYAPISLYKYQKNIGFLVMNFSSPIIRSCLEIIEDFRDNISANKYFARDHALSIIRIPDAVASALFRAGCDKNYFNYALYISKLCDAVLRLLLENASRFEEVFDNEGTSVGQLQCNACSKLLIEFIAKFGHLEIFLANLKLFLLERYPSEYTIKQLVVILVALFELSTTESFSKCIRISSRDGKYWLDFMILLLKLVEDHQGLDSFVERFLCESLNGANWESASDCKLFSCFRELFPKCFFASICIYYSPSREVLKFIYGTFLPKFEGEEESSEKSLVELTSVWGQKKWTEQSSIEADTSLASAVIYILLYYEKRGKKIIGDMLSHILDGISLRLESIRAIRFRENGMTVAAAYAVTAVEIDSQVLIQNQEFTRLYNNWLNEEEFSSPRSPAKERPLRCQTRSLFISHNSFPLNPDRSFFFFGLSNTLPLKERSEVSSSITDVFSFGMVTREADNLDPNIEVLRSFKECFNALAGVGRPVNAQLADVQFSIESALRGLYSLLKKCQENKRMKEAFKQELGPLCPTFLHTLISLSIHAPESKLKELLSMRFYVLVNIIASAPRIALCRLSNFLYSGTLGILQRAEIARAIGDAAVLLASDVQRSDEEVALPKKRIYPPIYSNKKHEEKFIGRNTRKWGYAAHNQGNRSLFFSNSLGTVAESFIQALLVRHDQDHFKFFQDHDPYTPSEILRSLMKIFQSISTVRHVAPSACKNSIEFFFAVLSKHCNNSVKHLGWISFEEVMRCWCGAPSRFFCLGESMVINSAKNIGRIALSKEWLDALEVGRHLSAKLVDGNDPLQHTSVDVVASLQDLVLLQDDLTTLASAYDSRVTLL